MKKLLFVAVCAALTAACACAAPWTNNVGFGFTMPVAVIGAAESGGHDLHETAYAVESTYLGAHERGFALKASVALGLVTTDDIRIAGWEADEVPDGGFFETITLGAGYSFVRTPTLLVGATASFGIELAQFFASVSYSYDDGGDTIASSTDLELTFATYSLGADLYARWLLTPHFGLLADVGVRCPLGGTARASAITQDDGAGSSPSADTSRLAGCIIIQPTLAVVWHF